MKTLSSLHDKRHMTVVQILKNTRLEKRLTQDQLAERLGVNRVYISKVESSDRNLTYLELIDYCKALEIDVHTVIDAICDEKQIAFENYQNDLYLLGYATGFLHGKGIETSNSIPARMSSISKKKDIDKDDK